MQCGFAPPLETSHTAQRITSSGTRHSHTRCGWPCILWMISRGRSQSKCIMPVQSVMLLLAHNDVGLNGNRGVRVDVQ